MNQERFYEGLEEGLEVSYKDCRGHIRFMSENYLTICIHTNPDPMKDVCILVYQPDWKNIKIES
jgi:hypothetical protein